MSDLISRKATIEEIWNVFNNYASDNSKFDEYETEAINNAFTVLQKVIEGQQTAYDVEKVVEELVNKIELYRLREIESLRKGEPLNVGVNLAKQASIEDCIEVVRRGGVE